MALANAFVSHESNGGEVTAEEEETGTAEVAVLEEVGSAPAPPPPETGATTALGPCPRKASCKAPEDGDTAEWKPFLQGDRTGGSREEARSRATCRRKRKRGEGKKTHFTHS